MKPFYPLIRHIYHQLIPYWWAAKNLIFRKETYGIDIRCNQREEAPLFDDTANKDEWQDEVYEVAKKTFDHYEFDSVIDLGCGSGYKLIKYFDSYSTIGIELRKTVDFLKETYPKKKWLEEETYDNLNCDMVICADVIEHVKNPTLFINKLRNQITFEKIIFSTPIRNRGFFQLPNNIYHYREWTQKEFHGYLSEYFTINEMGEFNQKRSQYCICSPLIKQEFDGN